jgi:hypothetical protein
MGFIMELHTIVSVTHWQLVTSLTCVSGLQAIMPSTNS